MNRAKAIPFILTAFICGNLLLIFIQYNSFKNINGLIRGNEKLLAEFRVSNELKELEKDVLSVETNIRGAVTTNNTSYIEGLDQKISEVEADLGQLQKITDDDSSVYLIKDLDALVHENLAFSKEIIDSFHTGGKKAAESVIATQKGKRIADALIRKIKDVDTIRQKLLSDVTSSLDRSGQKAQRFGTILITLVLISAALLFWYIINTIRNQTQLIQQLNISEKKVKETAELKENFLANMSHEIRTPMNAIMGFTQLLSKKPLDNTSQEYVQSIQDSGEVLLSVINDILDLSKIEAGMLRIVNAPFSIRTVVHTVEKMFIPKAVGKDLQLLTTVEESIPNVVEGDASRLTQILVNLVGNALKFTHQGTVSIRVSSSPVLEQMVEACIEVVDTGIGISPEHISQIFDRFHQGEAYVNRKYGGTGLGLSIVRDLVYLQKGTIHAASEPGKGTTIKITIPYKISNQDLPVPLPAEKTGTSATFEGLSVLIVEDNEINQRLLAHVFDQWELKHHSATNGKAALDMLKRETYDLIMMDIQMPEMDGYAAVREIRNQLHVDTPIIAMTAHALAGERERCLSQGMDEYISKPIREDRLYQLITSFIKPTGIQHKKKLYAEQAPTFTYISLEYMKEISQGDLDYEKTVTEEFLKAIPSNLLAMRTAWVNGSKDEVRHLAHDLKTTVSIMGLTEVLQPHLDALEYEPLNDAVFEQHYQKISEICEGATIEAGAFNDMLKLY